jgi:heme-degrading monooxygenase HmoA
MTRLDQPYTVGKWIAKAGKENLFISEWEAFAKWTARTQAGVGIGNLIQNRDRCQEFISFGPWENYGAIKAWRESPEFKAFAVKVRELCEDFQPLSFVLVASSEQ